MDDIYVGLFFQRLKDFPKCLASILRNPSFIFLSLAAAMEACLLTGVSTFGAKVVESLFKLTPSNAAFALGNFVCSAFISFVISYKLQQAIWQAIYMIILTWYDAFKAN